MVATGTWTVRGTGGADRVRAEEIRTLERQTAPVLLGNVACAAILGAALWSWVPTATLTLWLVAVLAVSVARGALAFRFRRASDGDVLAWGRVFVVGSLAAGLLWGAAGVFLFTPESLLHEILLAFLIGGLTAGAAGTNAVYLPAFFAFSAPAILPLLARLAAEASRGSEVHLAMTGLLAVFGVAMAMVARTTHGSIVESFRLRFENEALLKKLAAAYQELESYSRDLERRVKERTEELRMAQRMEIIGRFAGSVAHDFNNHLTVVRLNTNRLLRNDLPADLREAAEEIRDASERGSRLIEELLAFSRRQELEPRIVDLGAIVSDLERLVRRLVGRSIRVEVQRELAPLPVRVDPIRLEQLLLNLVANARDAMPRGGTLTLSTGLAELRPDQAERHGVKAGPFVVLEVADTGVGMDEETRRHLFEPFYTTKRQGHGGLGLSSAHGFVMQSGGIITVESQPGAGSRFRVLLPRAPAEDRP